MPDEPVLLGRIVRLQIQPESLKQEIDGRKVYHPGGLQGVDSIRLTNTGASALAANGEETLDVHNTTHPRSKHWGANWLSFGFTSHYAAMAREFGEHLTLGSAGENIIIETESTITLAQVAGGIEIATAGGPAIIEKVVVAAPCAPFATYALANPSAATTALKTALQFLNHGTRGFYGIYPAAKSAHLRIGDAVYARSAVSVDGRDTAS